MQHFKLASKYFEQKMLSQPRFSISQSVLCDHINILLVIWVVYKLCVWFLCIVNPLFINQFNVLFFVAHVLLLIVLHCLSRILQTPHCPNFFPINILIIFFLSLLLFLELLILVSSGWLLDMILICLVVHVDLCHGECLVVEESNYSLLTQHQFNHSFTFVLVQLNLQVGSTSQSTPWHPSSHTLYSIDSDAKTRRSGIHFGLLLSTMFFALTFYLVYGLF